jgi:hypothetical protein
MEYLELEQLINDGTLNVGDDVWMMHLQFQSGHVTFRRNLPPTKVRITAYQRRGFYDKNYAFHEVKRNGGAKVNRTPISLAGRVGIASDYDARFFLTEEEADAEYTLKCEEVKEVILENLDDKIRVLTTLAEKVDGRTAR